MLKKTMCLLGVLICLMGMTAAAERGAFPAVGVGAGPLGMGGAFVAAADTADAVYWNPAGAGQLAETQISSMQTDLFGLGIHYNWLSAVRPVGEYAVGLAYNGLDASEAFGEFPYQEGSILATIAGKTALSGVELRWGANLKYNYFQGGSELVNTDQKGLGVDLGLLYQGRLFKAGLVARDLYTKLAGQLVEDGAKETVDNLLQPDVALGVATTVGPALWTLDVSGLITGPKIHAGVEYAVTNKVFLRGGYNAGTFTAGLGIRTGKWVLDYAYNTHQAGDAQRFSVGLKF